MSTAVSTHDLRSHAKDHNRAKAHNSKWSLGSRPVTGRTCVHVFGPSLQEPCDECNKRPCHPLGRNYTALMRRETGKSIARDNAMTRKTFRGAVAEAVLDARDDLSDSSGDYEIDDSSAAPELSEVMYSYDAQKGPSHGSEILSYAINQAVQRYENNETEKIVKNEYDLVLDGKDEPAAYVADADDDFELIDDSHLK